VTSLAPFELRAKELVHHYQQNVAIRSLNQGR